MAGYEEQIRQNLAMFDRAMKMFTPFAYAPKAGEGAPKREPAAPEPAPAAPQDDMLRALQEQMAAMQAQINKLASKE